MATKLKNLKITSTDLVDAGANPDAHIRLFKNKDSTKVETEPTAKSSAETATEPTAKSATETIMQKAIAALRAVFAPVINEEGNESYISKGEESGNGGEAQISAEKKSVANEGDFRHFLTNEEARTVCKTHNTIKEETENMKFDKSKMTPEDAAIFTELEKRYGIPRGSAAEPTPLMKLTEMMAVPVAENSAGLPIIDGTVLTDGDGGIEKGAALQIQSAADAVTAVPDLHPEVKKALDVNKALSAEVAELKKSLEIKDLTVNAKKYEIIGKKADELAPKLYELKKAGGTAYDDYVALLDEQATLVEKGGLFGEIGLNTSGGLSSAWSKVEAAAMEISKRDGISKAQAIDKLGTENPSLIAEYRREMQ